MFRGFRIIHYRRNPCSSTSIPNLSVSIASAALSEDILPVFEHKNSNQCIETLPDSLNPLKELICRYQKGQSCFEKQAYAEIPIEKSALESFSRYQTHDGLVHRYEGSCSFEDAEQLHLQIIKNGFIRDTFLTNTLINVCVRTGDMAYAQRLFDEMPDRNGVSWTCLISGYTQHDMPDDACTLFCSMICAGFTPSHYALGSVLRACQYYGAPRLKFGMQIHGLTSKTRYISDVVVCNALISMYGSCSDSAAYALWVFDGMHMKNSISWNSIISVYSRRGNAVSAFELFSEMQQEDLGFSFRPNEYTLGSLITASCSSLVDPDLCLLEQLLAKVEKLGFLRDLYVGSAFVSGFARFGLLNHAMSIFEQMGERNTVSMNGLMVGLVRQKLGEEATEIFRQRRNFVGVNCDSYVVLLSAFTEFDLLEEGRRKGKEAHASLLRSGLDDVKVAVGNGLVNMYAKCGAIDDACTLFRLMDAKDLISWNSMISGLDQNERFEEAAVCFCRMKRTGLVPSKFTLISTLSSCASLGFVNLGIQIHCEAVKLGLDFDVSVSNSLLALYAETGYLSDCQRVFSLMSEHDQVSWNSIIGALADTGALISEVIEYFMEMMRSGWTPNKVTFINILASVSSLSLCELGHQVHALMIKYCVADDHAVGNALLSCYGKCGEMHSCEKIFTKMSERRDEVSWNSMIAGYIHNELFSEAMDFVWFMMHNGVRLDMFTFATVLSACASVSALERGMETHAYLIRACLESDVVVGSALLDMYSKCGNIDYASRVFPLMPVKNEFSWNSMISGYARHGHCQMALRQFEEMKREGQPPDHVTFVAVLSACSHVGLVDQGIEHFESMSKIYGLVPRMEHFSCIVDLLGRAGELDKVEDFINRMPMEPNILMWRTILGACSRANGVITDLGKQAATMLLELEPQNAVNYVLIANMYASGGKWEDVIKARVAMREAEVKKEAGCSWVSMKDGMHVFVAGDKSHPDTEKIYTKLKELNRKIRDAGYVPQIKFALYDVETENKEEILSYHSEKLALAFVLIRTSGLPIRIMKNLRVCGDCHSAFGYVSKIVGRNLILRDSNRFHHFVDGKCSCGDFW